MFHGCTIDKQLALAFVYLVCKLVTEINIRKSQPGMTSQLLSSRVSEILASIESELINIDLNNLMLSSCAFIKWTFIRLYGVPNLKQAYHA